MAVKAQNKRENEIRKGIKKRIDIHDWALEEAIEQAKNGVYLTHSMNDYIDIWQNEKKLPFKVDFAALENSDSEPEYNSGEDESEKLNDTISNEESQTLNNTLNKTNNSMKKTARRPNKVKAAHKKMLKQRLTAELYTQKNANISMYFDNAFSRRAGILQIGVGSPISEASNSDFPSPRRQIKEKRSKIKLPVKKKDENESDDDQEENGASQQSSAVNSPKSTGVVDFEMKPPGHEELVKEKQKVLRQIWQGNRRLPASYSINGQFFNQGNEQQAKEPTFSAIGIRKPTQTEILQNDKRNREWKLDMQKII